MYDKKNWQPDFFENFIYNDKPELKKIISSQNIKIHDFKIVLFELRLNINFSFKIYNYNVG